MYEKARIKSAEKKGIQKGMQRGIQKGRREEKLQVAKQMLDDGLNISIIMKYTGLSMEEIEEIRQRL